MQIRQALSEIFHTQTKKPRLTAPKNNLPQFTACGKEWQKLLRAGSHTPVSQQIT